MSLQELTPFLLWGAVLLALTLPFIPGLIEFKFPRDAHALHINMQYVKNPFYFSDMFAEMLKRALPEVLPEQDTEIYISLSKQEKIFVSAAPVWRCMPGCRSSSLVYARNDLESAQGAHFLKEIFAEGNVILGKNNVARAVLCRGGMLLRQGTIIARWASAYGDEFIVETGCNLGRSVSCRGTLRLERNVKFSSLCGAPVSTFSVPGRPMDFADHIDHGNIRESALVATDDLLSLPEGSVLRKNLISLQNLRICSGSTIVGDIKGHADVVLEDNVLVNGTIIAEGNVTIGPGCQVTGNILSQHNIILHFGVTVGEAGGIRSVVGRDEVRLHSDVTIYGAVFCNQGYVENYAVSEKQAA